MKRRQVIINAATSVIQVVITGAVLFVLYRFLLRTIGIEQLGTWSVVLGTSSLANIANIGLSGSVVKFVAKYLAIGEREKVAKVLQTATVSIAVLVGVVLFIAYPFAEWFLAFIIEENHINEALVILPYSFLSLWISAVGSIFQGGLDGCQRIDLKSFILTGAAAIYLALCFLLVPAYGLVGLAIAQVIETGLTLAVSLALLRHLVYGLPIVRWRWNRQIFHEMAGYGVNFQIISVASMLFEPATKAMLSKFGGLAMVGYYEMASRMIQQLRSLIISANKVLVPAIADLNEKYPGLVAGVYQSSYRLLFYLVVPFFSFVIVLLPLVSEFWIGYYQPEFIFVACVLCLAWFLNILAGPAYFVSLGTGYLRWNTFAHILIAIMNVIFGLVLGFLYSGYGVVLAFGISLLVGSMIIIVSYHIENHISLRALVPRESVESSLASVAGMIVAGSVYYLVRKSLPLSLVSTLIITFFLGIICFPIWIHPERKRITNWLGTGVLFRKERNAA